MKSHNQRPTSAAQHTQPRTTNHQPRTLTISRTTARFLRDGHPWVRPDRFTRGLESFRVGDVATLVDEDGRAYGTALIDPQAEICARVFHRKADARFDPAAAIERAWQRRAALHGDPILDMLPDPPRRSGFHPRHPCGRYGTVVVVLVLADCIAAHVDAICAALQARLPEAVIVIRDHRDDLRRAPVSDRRWMAASSIQSRS